MFAPSRELAEEFAAASITTCDERHRHTQELLHDYILKKFSPNAENIRQRVLLLVLKGKDAVLQTRAVTGHIVHERVHPCCRDRRWCWSRLRRPPQAPRE